MALRFFVNGATADYQTILNITSVMGPARLVAYKVAPGSSPPRADVIEVVLWSGDVIDGALDDPSVTKPLVSTVLSDFPAAMQGHIAGIAV